MTENKCYKVSFPSACFCSTVQLIQILSFLIKVILLLSLGEKSLRLFSYGYVMVTASLGFQKCRNHLFYLQNYLIEFSNFDIRRCQNWRTHSRFFVWLKLWSLHDEKPRQNVNKYLQQFMGRNYDY